VLGDRALQAEAIDAWRTWTSTSRDDGGRIAFSAAARIGWPYTPAEAALALEALGEAARASGDLRNDVVALASDLARSEILADHVQLWTPLGYWRDHVGLPCFGGAPVFAIRSGPPTREPLWTLRRP